MRSGSSSLTLLQAGGYANLPKQIAQYDDCLAAGADAILLGAIVAAPLARLATARGMPPLARALCRAGTMQNAVAGRKSEAAASAAVAAYRLR